VAAALLPAALALALACGDGAGEAVAAASAASTAEPAAAAQAAPAAAPAPRRRERPVPAFEGWTLDAKRLSLSELIGRRSVLFLFDPGRGSLVDPVARAVAAVAAEQADHNFSVVGVAGRAEPEAARAFVARHGLDFPVVSDPGAGLAERIGVTGPVALVVVDAEGYMVAGAGGFPSDGPDPAAAIESQLREWLRLPDPRQAAQPVLGERPVAPDFSAERLEGGRFELASLRGRPAVLIFFLHSCPHCHEALRFLKEELPRLPEATRPALLGVSVVHAPAEVRARLASDGLDFFPVVLDGNADVQTAYAAQGGVPVLFLLDAEGRIVARSQGWNGERDPALMRMRLARLAGQPAPLLLHATGYSGSEVCSVCHEAEHETWLLTRHATAF
jgi:peroxiredoxin